MMSESIQAFTAQVCRGKWTGDSQKMIFEGIGLQNQNVRANFDHFGHIKVIFVSFLSVLDVERVFRAHYFGAYLDAFQRPKRCKTLFKIS